MNLLSRYGFEPKLPQVTDEFCPIPESDDVVRYQCEHDYAARYAFNFYGEIQRMNEEYFAKRERCGNCERAHLLRMSTRCVRCGFVILSGSGATLCPEWKVATPAWPISVWTNPEGVRFRIGCMRSTCISSGGDCAGHWTSEGFKPLHSDGLSAIELALASRCGMAVLNEEGLTLHPRPMLVTIATIRGNG